MSEVLGYVVVEWPQSGDAPDHVGRELYSNDSLGLRLAREAAQMLQADAWNHARSERYTVHAVMAEEIEEPA